MLEYVQKSQVANVSYFSEGKPKDDFFADIDVGHMSAMELG